MNEYTHRDLLRQARRARRVWLYGKGDWDGPLLLRGDDEYGRLTLALRLPGERAIVWAYWTCGCAECAESRAQTARWAVDGP